MSTPPLAPSNLGTKAAHGVLWFLVQAVLGRGVSLLGQLVLARLLMPEDFGIIGLAITISAIFGLLVNFGVDQVLQQRGAKMYRLASSVFWLNLAVALPTTLLLAAFAPLGAHLYHNDKITVVVWILSLSIPFVALSAVPQVILQYKMRFRFLATYNTVESILTQILTIGFACMGLHALSFAFPTTILAIVKAFIFWKLAPVPLTSWRKIRGWKPLTSKGLAIFGSRISSTLCSQGDYITLGFLAPANVVGAYFFAFKLAVQPMTLLASNFSNVLLPTLTALAGDRIRQRDIAFKTVSLLGILTTPCCLGLAAVAQPLMTLMFGDKWNAAVIYIQILSFGLPLDALSWPTNNLLAAQGFFFKRTIYMSISTGLFYALVVTGGLLASAKGVAVGVAIFYIIYPFTLTLHVFVERGIAAKKVVYAFVKPYLFCIVSIGPPFLLSQIYLEGHNLAQVIFTSGVGGLGYIVILKIFHREFYNEIQSRLLKIIKAKSNKLC